MAIRKWIKKKMAIRSMQEIANEELARYNILVEKIGDKVLDVWLEALARNAAFIRYAESQVMGRSFGTGDPFGDQARQREAKELLKIWVVRRDLYQCLLEDGNIKVGPDVPDVWDEKMDAFIARYCGDLSDTYAVDLMSKPLSEL